MQKQFKWRKLGWHEVAKKGDYWARPGTVMGAFVDPNLGMGEDSPYIGNTVSHNQLLYAISHYDLWRCVDNDGPCRLPMNPIFSKPLPLP